MRKTFFLLLTLLVLLTVLLPANAPSRSESRPNAGPDFPFPLVGIVNYKGFNLSTNGLVMAICGTYSQGPAVIEIAEGKSWYSMEIPGDDPVTADSKEGCEIGEPITFTIQGEAASESTTWQVVTETFRHDISFGTPNMVFLPMIRR